MADKLFEGIYESLFNMTVVKDREVYLVGLGSNGEDISLCKYVAGKCKKQCNADIDDVTAIEFGEFMDCECPYALLYHIAVGYAEMRERLLNHEAAKIEGRELVLPCKVGDTLYILHDTYQGKNIIGTKIDIGNVDRFVVGYLSEPIAVTYVESDNYWISFELEDFGKTVFLTKPEAEAALVEMEGK